MSHFRNECLHGFVYGQCRCPGPSVAHIVACPNDDKHKKLYAATEDQPTCPFCERRDKRQYDSTFVGTHSVMNFEPLNPVTPGHRLFMPMFHYADASAYPLVTGKVASAAAEWGRMMTGYYNLIISVGSAATQTVEHLHWHYIPRRPADGLHLPWTNQSKGL